MNKPEQPCPPRKWEYEDDFIDTPIISKLMIVKEDYNEAEELEEWKDQHDWEEGGFLPNIVDCNYDNSMGSLQDLLDVIPDGVHPRDVVISINRDRYVGYIEFRMEYRTATNKEKLKAAYNADYAEYEKKLKMYEQDMISYEKWKRQERRNQLKKELEDLGDPEN